MTAHRRLAHPHGIPNTAARDAAVVVASGVGCLEEPETMVPILHVARIIRAQNETNALVRCN
jgi:hypothetical protein